jgi:hypothetical protein
MTYSYVYFVTEAGCGNWGGTMDVGGLIKTNWGGTLRNRRIDGYLTYNDWSWINSVTPTPTSTNEYHEHNYIGGGWKWTSATYIVFTGGGRFDDAGRVHELYIMANTRVGYGGTYDIIDVGLHGYLNCDQDEIAYILEHASWIGMRDSYSLDICQNTFGVSASAYTYSAESIVPDAQRFVPGTPVVQPTVRIGLAVGNRDFHSNQDSTRDRFFATLKKTHAALVALGWTVTWHGIVMSIADASGSSAYEDPLVFDAIQAEADPIPLTYSSPSGVEECLAQYETGDPQLDMIISASRLHALVLSVKMEFPTIALYLHDPIKHKYESFCDDHSSVAVVLDHLGDTDEKSTQTAGDLTTAIQNAYAEGHPAI